MKIITDGDGIVLVTASGDELYIVELRDTFDIRVMPRNGEDCWWLVDMQTAEIRPKPKAKRPGTP